MRLGACALLATAGGWTRASAPAIGADQKSQLIAASDTPLAAPPVEAEQEEAREREQTAEEDPLAQRQTERVDQPQQWADEPSRANIYGSVRVRYRNQTGKSFWGDGGSRLGAEGRWQFRPRAWLFGRAEAGFNVLDEFDRLLDPGSSADNDNPNSTLFRRLLYVGVEAPNAMLVLGKNWSPYYQVASFTDRFEGTGGSASGTYNAGTDGGPTGTGRADRALQTRILTGHLLQRWGVKPFNLNVQIQYDESIPLLEDVNYDLGISVSGVLQWVNDYTLGIAYNRATINRDQPSVRQAGIDGDAQALLLGTRWFGDRWYLGTVVSRLLNHETTDEDIYFDAWGWEVYGQYQIKGWVWAVGGWNYLSPDANERRAGEYLIKYAVLGLRYTFDEFRKMLYANVQFDNSRNADGTGFDDTYTIGIRWDLP